VWDRPVGFDGEARVLRAGPDTRRKDLRVRGRKKEEQRQEPRRND